MEKHAQLKASFETTYDELIEPIFRFLYTRLSDRERAKELAQETFMRTWEYLAKGNEVHNRKAFLYTTAKNLFRNEIRNKKEVISLDTLVEVGLEPQAKDEKPDRYAERTLIMEKMSELKPEYREALTLRYVDGFSVKDIAHILDDTPVTVSVRIHRALRQLRMLCHAK